MINKQAVYNAGVYCRLSDDEIRNMESVSIQVQKTLLTQFCQESGFNIVEYYIDDGFTGTNFERPDFKRMIEDIDNGVINLVVVKDLSRFGREYAQMGLYIEQYFEENDIRFIAVCDNIDTINGCDDILMPMKNVINSMYAKDCSKKTKAAHTALAKDGKYIGSHAPFGYTKDPNDRHKLIIDEAAANTVKKIFTMFSEGIGYVRMTKILRQEKVLNPQAYFTQNNPDFYRSDYWRKPFDWHATSVRTILNNPVYLGKTVFRRTRVKGIRKKRKEKVPEEEWIVVENTHEPIVSQETWDLTHKLMKSRRRERKSTGQVQPFAGLVKCAGCGSSLNLSGRGNGKYTSFSCWVYKNYGKERCTSHAIGYKTLCGLVLEDVRRNAKAAQLCTEQYKQKLMGLKTEKTKKETEIATKELKKIEKRIKEIDIVMTKIYEDNALGKLSSDRYQTMISGYEGEQIELKDKRERLNLAISSATDAMNNTEMFVDFIKRYTDIGELSAKVLNELIDKIVVHEKAIDEAENKTQQIDIYYKFVGYIKVDF